MAAKLMARFCGVSSCLTAVTTTAAVIATATAMTVFALEPRRSCFRTEAMTGSPPPTRVLIWNRSMLSAAVMTPCLLGSLVIGASTWTEAVQTRLIHDATAYELPARTGSATCGCVQPGGAAGGKESPDEQRQSPLEQRPVDRRPGSGRRRGEGYRPRRRGVSAARQGLRSWRAGPHRRDIRWRDRWVARGGGHASSADGQGHA